MPFDPETLVAIAATFFLAGTVKGVIGLGLPTVSLGVLTVLIDLPSAMALIIVPGFVTNVWQATVGGHGRALIRRIWPFLLTATVGIWPGAMVIGLVDVNLLSGLLGLLLIAYAATALFGLSLTLTERQSRTAGPLFGIPNGILTGMTGSFMVPGVLYLQGLGLGRDALVQAMGMLFMLSNVGLAVSLGGSGLLTADLGTASALGLIPALLGMAAGQRLRRGLSEKRFRQLFYAGVSLLGLFILLEAIR
ncbi:sulfite exporter TauE/SafE family protein [Nisaea acidiphila]|uniref:Probable membrane transporter protein n=1 Tax=Nisaea acidiphila TaxID=1862145 RepID=A0A9J7B1V8_9PROT|nr:sulfite exporter TauE/SafE family protein [Nisaea acidiphila]UUX51653.1 sulfite exporter TauE/SafE family protein [Nisaea acidiphila]